MSDTIYSRPGATRSLTLTGAPADLLGQIAYRIRRRSDGVVVVARTGEGVREDVYEDEVGNRLADYTVTRAMPDAPGSYTVLWDDGHLTSATTAADDLEITATGFAAADGGSIVDQLRQMVAVAPDQYEIGGLLYWTDGQLAEVLQGHVSQRLVQAPVDLIQTVGNGEVRDGRVVFAGTLDAEVAHIFDDTDTEVSDVTIHADGRLVFAESQRGRNLYCAGLAYDLNAAAAEVLTAWAAALKGGYDVTIDGQTLKRSQRHAQLLTQAREYGAKTLAGSVSLRRGDHRRRSGQR